MNWTIDLEDIDLDDIEEFDLSSSQAWEPVFSPYHGHVVPQWMVTKEARERMKLMDEMRIRPRDR